MSSIVYRKLLIHEAQLLASIDRAERIDAIYRIANGILELEETEQSVQPWGAGELASYVARLEAVFESAGSVFGAWDDGRLVGVGSLDPSSVGGHAAVMKLDMLYVDAGYRGRGIGRRLTDTLANEARARGATSLYISATPTRGTVDAYLSMGAKVLGSPDPEMLAREPEDIHLALKLV